MKALYISSIETFSGKTAFCLGIARRMHADGYRVGYLKPLSTQPHQVEGRTLDEDAEFVQKTLGLQEPPEVLAPVVLTRSLLESKLKGELERDLVSDILSAFHTVSQGKDIVLLEGGASLRDGYSVGLSTPTVARVLSARALVIVRWRGEMHLVDDALAAQLRLGDTLVGAAINSVPEAGGRFVTEVARPFLESRRMPILGALPQEAGLAAITVGDLADVLDGEFLVRPDKRDELVENLIVGAMTVESALPRFRRQVNKAVITGGDRADIQSAALETSTRALILTGNLRPSPMLLKQAEEVGVPVILVAQNTIETVEAAERVFGKTRLGHAEKLDRFERLLAEHFDFKRLYEALEL
jgi:BioD-like phosphotransacetylase family protein